MTDFEYRMLELEARKQNLLQHNKRLEKMLKKNPHVGKVIIDYSDDEEVDE